MGLRTQNSTDEDDSPKLEPRINVGLSKSQGKGRKENVVVVAVVLQDLEIIVSRGERGVTKREMKEMRGGTKTRLTSIKGKMMTLFDGDGDKC